MAEYTDKTALEEKIANIRVYVAAARQSGKSLVDEVLRTYRDGVMEAIRKAPTADVVNVCAGLCEALKDIVWYDGHTEWLVKLRDDITKAQKEGAEVYGNPLEIEEWHTEKHMIWMLLVGMFGDWGTSIRSGWIDNFSGCINFINAVVVDEEAAEEYKKQRMEEREA